MSTKTIFLTIFCVLGLAGCVKRVEVRPAQYSVAGADSREIYAAVVNVLSQHSPALEKDEAAGLVLAPLHVDVQRGLRREIEFFTIRAVHRGELLILSMECGSCNGRFPTAAVSVFDRIKSELDAEFASRGVVVQVQR